MRYFIDKNGDIYKFEKSKNYNSGPTKIGNLKEKQSFENNACDFGTTSVCANTIGILTVEYGIEGSNLMEYKRQKWLSGIYAGTKDTFSKKKLGGPFINVELANSYNEISHKYIKEEKYKEAIKLSSKALEINPKSMWALANRANAFTELKDFKNALTELNKMIEIDFTNPWIHNSMCHVNHKKKAYKEALKDCNNALRFYKVNGSKDSDKQTVWNANINLGQVKFDLGDKAGSCKHYQYALTNSNSVNTKWYERHIGSQNKEISWCLANNFISIENNLF